MTSSVLSEKIYFRPMQSRDIPEVVAIDRLSFSLPWSENAFYYELYENLNSLQWVAEVDGHDGAHRIAAVIVVWMIMDEVHVATLAVHPDYRRMGYARYLMITALTEAVRRGVRLATLEVRAENLAAQALYRQFRFEVVGRRPHYYVDNGEDALIMSVWPIGVEYIDWLHQTVQPKTNQANTLSLKERS